VLVNDGGHVLVLEQLSLYVYACMRMQTAMDQALIGSTNREDGVIRRCGVGV
jgi:hypothetical protein